MSTALEATIHGRKFRLGAPAGEQAALAGAISIVEAECAVITRKQPTAEIERVLLLAALDLAAKHPSTKVDPRTEARLLAITARAKQALTDSHAR
jgi:cell division protein ZapA (FtsZ GTPase activity inhibitor)